VIKRLRGIPLEVLVSLRIFARMEVFNPGCTTRHFLKIHKLMK
jgi:hypothetical protein